MVARWVIVVLSLVFILLTGANLAWHYSFASQIAPIRRGDDADIVAFRLEVEQDYETKGIDFMEQMGNRLRQDESRVTGGNSKLVRVLQRAGRHQLPVPRRRPQGAFLR
jgi:hypothetical protein